MVLKFSDDDTAFAKDAVRGGRMSRWRRVIEEIFNEQLRLRHDYEAVASRGEISWSPEEYAMLDPIDERERVKEALAEGEEETQAADNFHADLGFT